MKFSLYNQHKGALLYCWYNFLIIATSTPIDFLPILLNFRPKLSVAIE